MESSLQALSTESLLAELFRRDSAPQSPAKPACGSTQKGGYDTPIHVFALFLILFLSTASCGFPLLGNRSQTTSPRRRFIIFLCQHFGTGVLIATAFVHLLPTAFVSLTNPCLPHFFSKGYRPLAGLVAMVSALVVVALESYLTTRGAGHSHAHSNDVWENIDPDCDDHGDDLGGSTPVVLPADAPGMASRRKGMQRPQNLSIDATEMQGLVAGVSPLPTSTPVGASGCCSSSAAPASGPTTETRRSSTDGRVSEDSDLALDVAELAPSDGDRSGSYSPVGKHQYGPVGGPPVQPEAGNDEEQHRMLLQCLLLEAGILFHSVFIGMALSVATGPTFAVFLVAIAFHQSFEGLALGSRIAAIKFPSRSVRPWLMALAYGLTTPIGQAIGLVLHEMYDPHSEMGLLMVGFMNSISSGLLLFAGLVQLLAEDFLSEKSYKTLSGRKRLYAFGAMVGGAALMAGVGAIA